MGLGGHIFRWFFNLVGGTSRWVWGTIWRTLFKKKKFKYSEYINGPDNPDYYDNMGHRLNNILIGLIVFFVIIIPIISFLDREF